MNDKCEWNKSLIESIGFELMGEKFKKRAEDLHSFLPADNSANIRELMPVIAFSGPVSLALALHKKTLNQKKS